MTKWPNMGAKPPTRGDYPTQRTHGFVWSLAWHVRTREWVANLQRREHGFTVVAANPPTAA